MYVVSILMYRTDICVCICLYVDMFAFIYTDTHISTKKGITVSMVFLIDESSFKSNFYFVKFYINNQFNICGLFHQAVVTVTV